jgi:hypothetical protein
VLVAPPRESREDDHPRRCAVFDLELPMAQVAEAYAAMDERRSIKTLLWP